MMAQIKFIFDLEKMNKKMTIQFQANILFIESDFSKKDVVELHKLAKERFVIVPRIRCKGGTVY